MAWNRVTHSCGHEEDHQLYGKAKDRESKAQWLSSQQCTDCWSKDVKKHRDEKNALAAEENQTLGLPKLTGSEKQIQWAESIRNTTVKKLREISARIIENIKAPNEDMKQEICDAAILITDEICMNPSAKYWIDNRHDLSEYDEYSRATVDKLFALMSKRNVTPLTDAYLKAQKVQAENE